MQNYKNKKTGGKTTPPASVVLQHKNELEASAVSRTGCFGGSQH